MRLILKGCRWFRILLVLSLLAPIPLNLVRAQQGEAPVYIVQTGDTLADIAAKFRVSAQDILQINQIAGPDSLKPGDRLVLPGFPGVSGVLTAHTLGFGEQLRSLSRREQIPIDTLLALNPITTPASLYLGSSIILPQSDPSTQLTATAVLSAAEPLLALALIDGINPWLLAEQNSLEDLQTAQPGDPFFYSSSAATPATAGLLPWIDQIEVTPQTFAQGDTIELRMHPTGQAHMSGQWMGKNLHFFQDLDGTSVALAGVYALAAPGLYPLDLVIQDGSGAAYQVEQSMRVVSGNYPLDPHLTVDPQTIDPKITAPENDQVAAIVQPATPPKMWDGLFLSPAYNPKWINSGYGDRRYYNDDPHVYFHTGVDYSGGVGLPIKAAAAGVVVFTGPLVVRGNATFIDQGWGVYSAYYHQSRIDVKVGDRIQPGQVIGLIGATGRVTGAHLHWEVWVDGTQVDPLEWLSRAFP
jgi:murein DD-endopeptidase MepM/ murein hydrolase activator NlpD